MTKNILINLENISIIEFQIIYIFHKILNNNNSPVNLRLFILNKIYLLKSTQNLIRKYGQEFNLLHFIGANVVRIFKFKINW